MPEDVVKALESKVDHYVCIVMINGRTYIRTKIDGFEEKVIMIGEMAEEMEKIAS